MHSFECAVFYAPTAGPRALANGGREGRGAHTQVEHASGAVASSHGLRQRARTACVSAVLDAIKVHEDLVETSADQKADIIWAIKEIHIWKGDSPSIVDTTEVGGDNQNT